MFIRRHALHRLGCFDERLATAEDAELSHRVVAAGKKLYFEERAVVRHHTRALFMPYVWQKLALGHGAFSLLFGGFGVSWKQRVLWSLPMLAVLFLSLGWLPALWLPGGLLLWLGGVLLYGLVWLLQSLAVAKRPGDVAPVLLSILIGNLGPGLGSLAALIKLDLDIHRRYRDSSR